MSDVLLPPDEYVLEVERARAAAKDAWNAMSEGEKWGKLYEESSYMREVNERITAGNFEKYDSLCLVAWTLIMSRFSRDDGSLIWGGVSSCMSILYRYVNALKKRVAELEAARDAEGKTP
jgi:hypothetical protein